MRPRLQPYQGRGGQPGYHWLGRVSSRQGISCNSQDSRDTLQIILVLHDRQRQDEALHSKTVAGIALSMSMLEPLHDKTRGYLHLQCQKEVLKEVGCLMDMNPNEIPLSSQYLLEMDSTSLYTHLSGSLIGC
jgi:hypothetical protein